METYMPDLLDKLHNLHRPRLLIRAARHGSMEYNRNRDLRRLLRSDPLPAPARAVHRLMDLEADLEVTRQQGDNAYSPSKHVAILSALMGEAQSLPPKNPCA